MEFLFQFPHFIGILLQTLGTCFLVILGLMSWYEGEPRRFFRTCFTYKHDPSAQSCARFLLWAGWFIILIGTALVIFYDNPAYDSLVLWITYIIHLLFCWVLSKIILLIVIIIERIWHWIFPPKKES